MPLLVVSHKDPGDSSPAEKLFTRREEEKEEEEEGEEKRRGRGGEKFEERSSSQATVCQASVHIYHRFNIS